MVKGGGVVAEAAVVRVGVMEVGIRGVWTVSVEVLEPMMRRVLLFVVRSRMGVAASPEPSVIGEPGASVWVPATY
jgi:hypothetical protein